MRACARSLVSDMDYTADLLRVCGVAILCSVCLLVMGRGSAGVASALRIGGGVLIFGSLLLILGKNVEVLEGLFDVVDGSADLAARAFSLMLKALGIAFISKFCSDVCRDCGEATLAGGVESVGRLAIISLSLPVVAEIIGYASAILQSGG